MRPPHAPTSAREGVAPGAIEGGLLQVALRLPSTGPRRSKRLRAPHGRERRMTKAWWAATSVGAAGWLGLLSSSCGAGGTAPTDEVEAADMPRLTDLQAPLSPARAPLPGPSRARLDESRDPGDPRANVDDPSCQDTCASRRAECGSVCGKECGQCPEGEDCKDNKCECSSSCDGTRCANACGEPCTCPAGTACDQSGLCVPGADCSGPFCAGSRALPEAPSLPEVPPEPAER